MILLGEADLLILLSYTAPALHHTFLSIPLAFGQLRYQFLSSKFRLLVRVFDIIILPQPHLLLLLRRHMFNPDLLRPLLHKLADESRIPQLARHAQIFATSHHGVGFAPFSGGGDALGGEVVLFASCN